MKTDPNPHVDTYLLDGCMRCKYGGTAQCKVRRWVPELETLRQIVLETGLQEEIKWGVPVYTLHGKNIVTLNALKDSANLGFYKGAIMKDEHRLLLQQGTIQAGRIIKFTNAEEILRLGDVLKSYILEAVDIEQSGRKVEMVISLEPIPDELLEAFEKDPAFEQAFYRLTPGRQRGYVLHFSQPKQAQTRVARIERLKGQIFQGVGLHDAYRRFNAKP